jgi:hypothetical protein
MMPLFPVPKICECKLSDLYDSVDARLAKMDEAIQGGKWGEAVREVKKVQQTQKELYKLHVTEYRYIFNRNMVELHKFREINGNARQPPLQTNAWQAGDLRRVVEPPTKKQKKDKKPPQ